MAHETPAPYLATHHIHVRMHTSRQVRLLPDHALVRATSGSLSVGKFQPARGCPVASVEVSSGSYVQEAHLER